VHRSIILNVEAAVGDPRWQFALLTRELSPAGSSSSFSTRVAREPTRFTRYDSLRLRLPSRSGLKKHSRVTKKRRRRSVNCSPLVIIIPNASRPARDILAILIESGSQLGGCGRIEKRVSFYMLSARGAAPRPGICIFGG